MSVLTQINITPSELQIVKDILARYLPEHSTVIIFGSRVRGTATSHSDLDLAIAIPHQEIDLSVLSKLRYAFDESRLPYKVDLADLNAIDAEFKQVISNEGRRLSEVL
jgi:predicted nucleotidyltransferase